MPGRRTSARPSVAVASLADTGHDGTDRVMIQAEQNLQDLQDRVRGLRSQVLAVSGRFLGRQILTGSGTYAPSPGTTLVRVRMIGGGGGGGGAGGGANVAVGAGGATGRYLDFVVGGGAAITGGAYSCGGGGSGGANTGGTGGTGGSTTIVVNRTTYTATGGGGGTGLASTAASGFAFPGGLIGGSSTADVSYAEQGQPGILVNTLLFWGGSGGSTEFGAGGGTGVGSQNGNPGLGFGSGGGGAGAAAAGKVGGAGAPGAIDIEEYS